MYPGCALYVRGMSAVCGRKIIGEWKMNERVKGRKAGGKKQPWVHQAFVCERSGAHFDTPADR